MSVDADIIAKLADLLDGSDFGTHPDGSSLAVPVGKLVVVNPDELVQGAPCDADPRPVAIIPGEHYAPTITGGRPANVAGHERYDARVIRILVNYGYNPDDGPTAMHRRIADDRLTIKNALEYPYNLDLVDGWVISQVVADAVVPQRNQDGPTGIFTLALEVRVEYRETLP